MTTFSAIEQEIIDDFALFDDAMDKYEHIIEMGTELAPLDEMYKTDSFIVKGCQSKVWLRAYAQDDKIFFEADSNTVITKGIVAILVKALSGNSRAYIQNHDLVFLEAIDLKGHLSSQRANGLTAMIQQMKKYAEVL